MKLVLIIGSGAVGKMTVGQALMARTGLRLFHNHMIIEPVLEVFGKFDGNTIARLRQVVFEEFLKSGQKGMIFTFMWAFDQQADWDYVMKLADMFDSTGNDIYCVELVAPQEIRLARNGTENRLKNKASKRDLEFSNANLMHEDSSYRLVSNEGEIPFRNYMRIDNSHIEPEEAARMIAERFGL